MSFVERNRAAWNHLAETGSQFAHVATDAECRNALATLDGRGWLPASIRGLDVLCLAAGGGWQSILYATAGANVTVVDPLTGPEIARRLFVSVNTLRTHTKHIFTKLDVNTRQEAVRRARELGVM